MSCLYMSTISSVKGSPVTLTGIQKMSFSVKEEQDVKREWSTEDSLHFSEEAGLMTESDVCPEDPESLKQQQLVCRDALMEPSQVELIDMSVFSFLIHETTSCYVLL